ncbi:MAG: MarR family transcriptional regulator [Flavobacteriales bacterium]|nr:MarR family transcriptional regulator [Flavobacteriales bacterium]
MKLEDELKSKFRNEAQKARLNIYFTYNFIGGKMQELMKSYGLTATQYNILRILRGQETKTASVGMIKERMIEKNSDVSRLLDRLLAKNFIERNESKSDRRQKDVKILKSGLDLLKKMDSCEEKSDQLLSNLSEKEIKELNYLLDKIRE